MRFAESRMRLLVLYANYTDQLSYYNDWLDAFCKSELFLTTKIDIVSQGASELVRSASKAVDAIVLLHSTNADTTSYLEPCIGALLERRARLLSFVGNEVNIPGAPISDKRRLFSRIQPEFIATQLLQEAGVYLFGDVAVRSVVAIPHALNPDVYQPECPSHLRPIDIGARSAKYLPHIGDVDRNRLLAFFQARGSELGLKTDISDRRRTRKGWADFLNSCKGTVATEAGSWFLERDDRTVNKIRDRAIESKRSTLVIRQHSKLYKVAKLLPARIRRLVRSLLKTGFIQHEALIDEGVDADEVLRTYFSGRQRPPFYGKCISSRHFDAIGTKTCQIMFPGRFNDILVADQHYFALSADFSNLKSVLEQFKDPAARHRIADTAYSMVMERHTYTHRMRSVYDTLASSG
jgi:hypothetical protein